ncbi:LAME_0F18360g1_1 [Lachancea meyersii CBS 8951]|uniref:LAME_0F18360g1_1 n=1 Tax=Lachancea meyersii CBS 8951 TaxID=1266667 RepID=A0A1G4K0T7_9SACH|nr:LAME_0F18360g1_1 [Lachancea meyersii CBS 8951]
MPGSEGIVHGHIHNFNNVTYIHGHVHGSSAPAPAVPNLPLSPTGSGTESGSGSGITFSTHHDECHHFEFMNCHNLNVFGEDKLRVAPEGQLASSQHKKRRTHDCTTCNPNVMELCCEDEHLAPEPAQALTSGPGQLSGEQAPGPIGLSPHSANSSQSRTISNLVMFKGANSSSIVDRTAGSPATAKLPNFIDCNLTCVRPKSEEDQLYEKLCEQCVDLDHNPTPCSQSHTHTTVPTTSTSHACSEHSHSHSHFGVHDHHSDDYEALHSTIHPSQCHEHIANSATDMMIMDDLVNISNMYDFPFGKHFHPHDHSKDANLNLLQTSIPDSKDELPQDSSNKPQHRHHHHSVELHSHPAHNGPSPADLSYNCDGSSNSNDCKPPVAFEKSHHTAPLETIVSPDAKTSTVNFNWIYKNEPQSIECNWNHCPEVCNSLLELQSHVLKNHVIDANFGDSKLPTPKNQYFCEWADCGFEGDDLCTLINHINGEHGIAFDMKFLDREKLLEQNEHQHALHCTECSDFPESLSPSAPEITITPKEDSEHVHECKWDHCGLKFASCADLNNHIETVHIPRGKSSYVCGWEGCGKTITQRQKLLRHLRVHTRYKPCKCPHCSKTFSTQDILLQHIRTHSGEKPYKCTHCGKGFATSSSLRIHIRTHTGEKPLECKVCGKRFNESSNLSKHMRTHERKYKCNGCKRSFDHAEQLEAHQSRCSHCATFK